MKSAWHFPVGSRSRSMPRSRHLPVFSVCVSLKMDLNDAASFQGPEAQNSNGILESALGKDTQDRNKLSREVQGNSEGSQLDMILQCDGITASRDEGLTSECQCDDTEKDSSPQENVGDCPVSNRDVADKSEDHTPQTSVLLVNETDCSSVMKMVGLPNPKGLVLPRTGDNINEVNSNLQPVKTISSSDTVDSPPIVSHPCFHKNVKSSHKLTGQSVLEAEHSNIDTSNKSRCVASDSSCVSQPGLKQPRSTKLNCQTDAVMTGDVPIKTKRDRKKTKPVESIQKSIIPDFFPIRRSGRQTKSEIEKQKRHQLEQMILSHCEDGLQITDFKNKGRGVTATKKFSRGDFVVEYAGELIDVSIAREREQQYKDNPNIGCYMYYFKCGTKQFCIDATKETDRLGRLINHSREGNCMTKVVEMNSKPRLILVANRDIKLGEELSYDYGDRSKVALEAYPWLKS